ncbi:hypothetical protein GP486_003130 [Trichoglossum hirsutum]|uniref:TauD/TfdA-like domain-containing protein n=1 Tax=Trichoglossum hirsutum TaxID=265104 RepID=A0A9P8RR30_9PEZI|nr:hypothetical protein GP486_003130 [Trichoglossum hirsutum]
MTVSTTTPQKQPGSITDQFKPTLLHPIDYNKKIEEEGSEFYPKAKYPHYLPTWNPQQKYPALEPFEYYEHGRDADPTLPEILGAGVHRTDLTPSMGSEISGVQLSSLSNAGKDQLALFVAQRKVVAFRNQDFAELPIQEALDFCKYFGRLNIHPTTGSPKGYPEVHIVHVGAGHDAVKKVFTTRNSSMSWHSDVSFELQPAGTTFMYSLEMPESGGDTVFSDNVEAYNRLSASFQQRLHGLRVMHSGKTLTDASIQRNGVVRKEPVSNAHPLVRTHPATGEKALFISSPTYANQILGLKKEESDTLLKFLYDLIANSLDLQVRIKWTDKTVVVWDNRLTSHAATFDWANGKRRHLARITPEAEQPYETPFAEPHGNNSTEIDL